MSAILLRTRDWRDAAVCQYTDPELFFPGEEDSEAAWVQSCQARRVCLGCPVRRECLSYALRAGEQWGTWGGLTELELQRERRRGGVPDVTRILAEADARYFDREDRRLAANDRRLAAERKHRENAAEMTELMGLVA